jgi:hypothetical protein
MASSTWTVVEPSLPALTNTYSFGPGHANALALVVDGGVVVISPSANPTPELFVDLEGRGPVKALLAPNAVHTMGIAPWKARYPDVPIFAPAQSIPRIEKTAKVGGIRPLAEAAKLVGDRVELLDMPYYKSGEVLVRWRTEGGWAWFLTDVALAFPELPKGPFGVAMKWTKSGPGLRRNAISGFFAVKDKQALYAWIREQSEKTPPSLVVPCHGEPVKLADPVAGIRAAFA